MPEIHYVPLSQLNQQEEASLIELMRAELRDWLADFCWDYTAIQQILLSWIRQRILPGYLALTRDGRPVGYIYLLLNRNRGNIGALYTVSGADSQKIADELLSISIAAMKTCADVHRIEAQILPFHQHCFAPVFTENGFAYFPRGYLRLSLTGTPAISDRLPDYDAGDVIAWRNTLLEPAAAITATSYQGHPDAVFCEEYRTGSGCENYLRGMIDNPGCGEFMPQASFMGLDRQGCPQGYVVCCRISTKCALIPQIVVHPAWQGRHLGATLMRQCVKRLREMGFVALDLAVTDANSRAVAWYQRLGFQRYKDFGAVVWERL